MRVRLAFVVAALVIGGTPSQASDLQAGPPANASADRYSDGWSFDLGWRRAGEGCVAAAVPPNAFATSSRYGGRGWECARGFRDTGGACVAIHVPESASLSDFGDRWTCDRGFRSAGGACAAIGVPPGAHLSDSAVGPGWTCGRGSIWTAHVAHRSACRKTPISSTKATASAGAACAAGAPMATPAP